VTGFKLPTSWPSQLKAQWKTPVGLGEASPALVGDRVYAFGREDNNEVIRCLEAATGKVVWEEKYDATTNFSGDRGHPGPRGSVSVADGKVCTLGVAGVLSCLDAGSGKVVWRKDSKEFPRPYPQFHTGMSPILEGGLCIAHLGGDGNGAVVAYNLASGTEIWRWAGEGPSYGSPVIAEIAGTRQLITPSQKMLVGISVADGKLLWSTPFVSGRYTTGTPVVDGANVYIFGRDRILAVMVEKQGDQFAVKELWTKSTPGSVYTTPVLKDGLFYGANSQGALFCIKAENGEEVWQDTTRRGDPAFVLDAGPVLLCVTAANSELAVLEPGGTALKEIAKIKIADTPVWSYPIFSGNRVFIKDRDSLAMATIE
jgi:outer membrane protein assembly factor BamB